MQNCIQVSIIQLHISKFPRYKKLAVDHPILEADMHVNKHKC
jgi:hypothetical protein